MSESRTLMPIRTASVPWASRSTAAAYVGGRADGCCGSLSGGGDRPRPQTRLRCVVTSPVVPTRDRADR
jgi:hypothetical protein